MQVTIPFDKTSVSAIGTPIDANNAASRATLAQQVYTSSDPTLFTVTPDTSTPGGAIVTRAVILVPGGQPVSATLLETALATEPNGTTEKIQGVATVILTAPPPPPPPPPPPAVALQLNFGTPQ